MQFESNLNIIELIFNKNLLIHIEQNLTFISYYSSIYQLIYAPHNFIQIYIYIFNGINNRLIKHLIIHVSDYL